VRQVWRICWRREAKRIDVGGNIGRGWLRRWNLVKVEEVEVKKEEG
jgi:hypothetical protein